MLFPLAVNSQELVERRMPAFCGDTKTVISIPQKYNEHMFWSGEETPGVIVSVWNNLDTKSFTIIKTHLTSKTSCVIASGDPVTNPRADRY